MKKKRDDNSKNGSNLSFFKNLLRGQGPLRQIGFKALYFLPSPQTEPFNLPSLNFPNSPSSLFLYYSYYYSKVR